MTSARTWPAHADDPQPPAGRSPGEPSPDLRRIFRSQAASVAIITATGAPGPVGFTATSLTSLSVEPPLVSFNVGRAASSWATVVRAQHVGIHLLGPGQEDLATRFARHGADRFAPPTSWTTGPCGVPVLGGTPTWLVARIRHRWRTGDHTLLVARLEHLGACAAELVPLLYHDGRFRVLAASAHPVVNPPIPRAGF